MQAEAYSPCHITGFFEVCENPDPLRAGSRGAGFSIDRGVTTHVRVEKSASPKAKITINGRPAYAETSRKLLELYAERVGPFSAQVDHKLVMPIGAGFGTSGAGALSLSLALNEALNAGFSQIEAAQLAHVAEVVCRTGLGTVIAEFFGGFEIRVEAGAPGIGKVVRIPLAGDHRVVCAAFRPLPTSLMLAEPGFLSKVNTAGRKCLEEALTNPSVERFLKLSRAFAEDVGLLEAGLRELVEALDEQGIMSSVAMIGRSLFTIVNESDAAEVVELLKRRNPTFTAVCNLEPSGARLL